MRILLSNDDGIYADGLRALVDELKSIGEVWVVAPEREMSAAGHSITIFDPLRVEKIQFKGAKNVKAFYVNGTPADCVKLAVRALMPELPDIVVSGINKGANVAHNVIYSGTVSAATEGSILGIPAIAVSLRNHGSHKKSDFALAARFIRHLVPIVLTKNLPEHTLLNVNFPHPPIKGIKVTKQAKSIFVEEFDRRLDPAGRVYYWQTGKMSYFKAGTDVDDQAMLDGYVSITPLHHDLTKHKAIPKIRTWSADMEKALKQAHKKK